MKKKLMVIAVCAVVFATFFTGCGTSIKTDVINNMADIRYNLFVGQAENVSVNLMCGMRENPYQSDGIAKKNVQFGVITATFKVHPTQIVHFALTVGSQTFAGVMEENPYNHTYMVDIEKIVSSEEGVYLTIENVAQNMQLIPESKDWTVQYGQALDIGISALEEDLKTLYEKRKFKAECFLKIIFDEAAAENPYYWCFGYTAQNGSKALVIFDVHEGKILSEKTVNP